MPADRLGCSAVLAAVTVGCYVGWKAPEIASPATRLQGFGMWELLQFLLNAFLFVLIGLQLPFVLDGLGDFAPGTLLAYGAAVSTLLMFAMAVWVFVWYLSFRRDLEVAT